MRARWALSALAMASAVASGCGPKVKPGWPSSATRRREVRSRDGHRGQAGGRRHGFARAHEAVGAREIPLARRAHAGVRRRRGAAAVDEVRAGGPAGNARARRLRPGKGGQVVVRDRALARHARITGALGHARSAHRGRVQPAGAAPRRREHCVYVSDTSRSPRSSTTPARPEDARAASRAAARAAGARHEVAVRVQSRS